MSIVDGTWGSGAPPREIVDFVLMEAMHWTWRELQDTPLYVRRYCWDILQLRWEHESDEMERQRRQAGG